MIPISASASPIFWGPTPYLSAADIPGGFYATGPTGLEDFEDGSIDFGLTLSTGSITGPGALVDSVDADDGSIDGSGTAGHSYTVSNGYVIVTFASPVTAAAIVWTDAYWLDSLNFEAFAPGGASLGGIFGVTGFQDTSFAGGTAEDRFVGVQDPGGIESIRLYNISNPGLEIDHVQFGIIPEPSTVLLLGLGLLVLSRRKP